MPGTPILDGLQPSHLMRPGSTPTLVEGEELYNPATRKPPGAGGGHPPKSQIANRTSQLFITLVQISANNETIAACNRCPVRRDLHHRIVQQDRKGHEGTRTSLLHIPP